MGANGGPGHRKGGASEHEAPRVAVKFRREEEAVVLGRYERYLPDKFDLRSCSPGIYCVLITDFPALLGPSFLV